MLNDMIVQGDEPLFQGRIQGGLRGSSEPPPPPPPLAGESFRTTTPPVDRHQNKLLFLPWPRGGGGGGGVVDSQTSRSLDSFLSLADTELRPVVCRLRIAWETRSLISEWGGEGSLILKILDHLIP